MSGTQLRATIAPTDHALADRLTAGIRELTQSLEQRGLPEPRVTIRLPAPDIGIARIHDPPSAPRATEPYQPAPSIEPGGQARSTDTGGTAREGERHTQRDEDARSRWYSDQADRHRRDQRAPDRRARHEADERSAQ